MNKPTQTAEPLGFHEEILKYVAAFESGQEWRQAAALDQLQLSTFKEMTRWGFDWKWVQAQLEGEG